jgi:hypothetical protein
VQTSAEAQFVLLVQEPGHADDAPSQTNGAQDGLPAEPAVRVEQLPVEQVPHAPQAEPQQ